MKTEDFERLKKLCDENGFELVTESPNENEKFFVVKKKKVFTIQWVECDLHYMKFAYSGNKNLIPRMKELAELLEKYLNNEIE